MSSFRKAYILRKGGFLILKKLFHFAPLIEIENCQLFKIHGNYKFKEASSSHCQFVYEDFDIVIEGERIHIDLMREMELIIRIKGLLQLKMQKQEKSYEKY